MRDRFVQVREKMEAKPKNCLNQTRSCNGEMGENGFILRVRKPDPKDGK